MRRCVGGDVGDRIDQQLVPRNHVVAANLLAHDGREVTTGAVPRHSDPVRRKAPRGGHLHRESPCRDCIVDGGGERILRREPIVNRQYVDAGVEREVPHDAVVAGTTADGEAAAMVVDHQTA